MLAPHLLTESRTRCSARSRSGWGGIDPARGVIIDWILLIPSLAAAHTTTVIRPTSPAQLVPFTLQWNPNRARTMAVARFVHAALTAELPPGWHTQPDHLHHHG